MAITSLHPTHATRRGRGMVVLDNPLGLERKQKPQRVAVGPKNAQCISIRCGAARAGIVVWGPAAATAALLQLQMLL